MLGFFDSGFGGLTILKECRAELPQYDYLYLGDNKRAPYGERSAEEIVAFTQEGVATLFEQGATLVILACNTASAVALRKLQQEWLPKHAPDKRILGVLVPTIEQITGVPWMAQASRVQQDEKESIGILATPATVAAGTYPEEIALRAPDLPVFQQACPDLVEAIEADDVETQKKLVVTYVAGLTSQNEITACILGCTHYELIAERIREQLPSATKLYRQPEIVAESLAHYLDRHPNLVSTTSQAGTVQFLTTGDPQKITPLATRYFGEPVSFTSL